jgi:hypothetical protein
MRGPRFCARLRPSAVRVRTLRGIGLDLVAGKLGTTRIQANAGSG